jgi:hypothetical protein
VRSPARIVGAARRRRRLERAARRLPPAPFVVGAGRSGTTLLRLMLDAHPKLAVPPETQFIPQLIDASRQPDATASSIAELLVSHRRFGDFGIEPDRLRQAFAAIQPFDLAEGLRWFYRTYAADHGKPRWGDKSPGYGWRMRPIDRLLPEARFVHLIRDGRDVALSMRAQRDDLPSAAKLARHWRRRVRKTRRQGASARHYMELRYEDLVTDPERELRRICEFIDLEFDPGMLTYHERAPDRLAEIARDMPAGHELYSDRTRGAIVAERRVAIHKLTSEPVRGDRVAKWRDQMSEEDRGEFDRVAGELLAELGYDRSPATATAK